MLGLAPLALAAPDVPPPNRLAAWDAPVSVVEPGTRVGMIAELRDDGPARIEAWDGARWIPARETTRIGRTAILVADFDVAVTTTRLRSPDRHRIRSLDWDLFVPLGEPRRDGAPPPSPGVLPAALTDIGVTSRAAWGARATTCTSTEDDWYRMAIHHTAGSQTYGGSVQGTVQVLQSYSMDSGEYCDIPYQFLVGYDGSLWEGRPYDYTSGATGGGNNDGNIAVSFLGCYHPSGCATSHAVTEAMIEEGQRLVQTLGDLHDIPSDADAIRGHRDWPGNATACPGDWLYDRLDDLRSPLLPDYAGVFAGQSFPLADAGAVTLALGEEASGFVDLTNVGAATWSPGVTNLGTLPRDTPSAVADETWLSATRPATVEAATPPGANGRFRFTLQGSAVGEQVLQLAPVQEGVTWFADDGGPAEGAIAVRVVVLPTAVDDTGPLSEEERRAPPGDPVALAELNGCGCAASPGAPAGLALAAVGALLARRGHANGRRRPRTHRSPARA